MKQKLNKLINLIYKERQILFVSFAMITSIFLLRRNMDPNILFADVSLLAATAGKAVANKIGKAALVEGGKGAISGASNAGEDESKLGAAAKGAARGAVSGAANAGLGEAKNAIKAKTTAAHGKRKVGNTGTTSAGTPSSGSPKNNDAIKNMNSKPKSMDDDNKKIEKSDTEKDKDSAKKDRLSSDVGNTKSENETDIDEGSSELKKGKGNVILTLLIIFIAFNFFIGIFATYLISPQTKVFRGISSSGGYLSQFLLDIYEKSKNFFAYGHFDENENILEKTAQDLYEEIYDEYRVEIDLPLLLASILADGTNYLDEIDEYGNPLVNYNLQKRFEHLEELAYLQLNLYESTYECILDSDGNPSMKIISKTYLDGDKKETNSCGTTNVGKEVYRYTYELDVNDYYTVLEENKDVLEDIYGEDQTNTDAMLTLLIAKIKQQKDVFDVLYGISEDICESPGNIPPIVLSDPAVDLQAPLNDGYNITSYYGYRTLSGTTKLHSGIDVVGDKNIYAAGTGVVYKVYFEANAGGNVVEIKHTTSDGRVFISQYGHLKTVLVSVGDSVVAGETKIGIMGATGVATGVHLHFQFWEIVGGQVVLYNPLTIFVGATNYSYKCVGSNLTSDTCTSTEGSIAYISNENDYNYNLIRAIFIVKGINDYSQTKNNIVFDSDFESYINSMRSSTNYEIIDKLMDVDLINQKIRVDGTWYEYIGNSISTFTLRSNFIAEYGALDPDVFNHIIMGVGKLKGSYYEVLGYDSAKEMYETWNSSHHKQVEDFIKYLTDYLGLEKDLKNKLIMTDAKLQNIALDIAEVYFGDSSEYEDNQYAKAIVYNYNNYEEKGESLENLLNDCSDLSIEDETIGVKGEKCEMYVSYWKCLANIAQYDNDAYWGNFIKQAGTSTARVKILSVAHEYWGYVRYCNERSNTYTTTGQQCILEGYSDSIEFDDKWSTLVGPVYGDVLAGLDCGGFITRVYTTYIRRNFFEDRYIAYEMYKPAYVLRSDTGMCASSTDYTTVHFFNNDGSEQYKSTYNAEADDILNYYANTTDKIKPGDVICDLTKNFDGDGEYIGGRHTMMYIGYDDADGDNELDSTETMYFIHTGDTKKGVEVVTKTLNKINDKNHIYDSVFTPNDIVN